MLATKRTYTTERQRKDIVSKWRASGLKQSEFCRQENIPEWALSAWKRLEQERSVLPRAGHYGLPPRRGKPLVAFWKRILQDQALSGLSAPKFCKRHGLNARTFHGWRRRLGPKQRITKDVPQQNPFVEVLQAPAKATEDVANGALEILLSGGSTVKVTEQTPLALLVKVLRMLEVTC